MSYTKKFNKKNAWEDYCQKHFQLISLLALPEEVFRTEANFRDFVTYGKLTSKEHKEFDFSNLDNELFWKLFYFITNYFDMDAILFDKFEIERINKSKV